MSQWHGGKGSAPRPRNVDKETWEENWERVFGKKDAEYESENPLERPFNYKEKQQDLTELNSDGNRDRGRYGEDLFD